MAITPSMGAMGWRSTATILGSSFEPAAFAGRYNLRLKTWLQLPGAAHRSTAFLTPALSTALVLSGLRGCPQVQPTQNHTQSRPVPLTNFELVLNNYFHLIYRHEGKAAYSWVTERDSKLCTSASGEPRTSILRKIADGNAWVYVPSKISKDWLIWSSLKALRALQPSSFAFL